MEYKGELPQNPDQKDSSELEAERQRIREEIQLELEQLPDDESGRERREFLTREPAFYAYGGKSFEGRRQTPGFRISSADARMGVLQDVYGLRRDHVTFGVGRGWNRKYIIHRELQNPDYRGGYPYTFLFDPGEETWRLYGQNGALLLRNVQRDTEIHEWFTLKPEKMTEARMQEYVERLNQADRSVEPQSNASLEQFLKTSGHQTDVQRVGSREMAEPNVEQMAAALAAMPESARRESTWLIGGGSLHGEELGARIVWDPRK
ncbi:MAG: hypothetical protein HY567_01950 [Candidatus Kerfeldbacteria bacterium]|nr:hypothetical protein [Candidatus Kerfeldbacteria bacterium]